MKIRLAAGGLAVALLVAGVAAGNARGRVKIYSAKNRDAYALAFGSQWMSANQSIEEVESIRSRYDGDFLWLRRRGDVYLVRDAAKLQEARGLFDSLHALEPEQKELARRQRFVEKKQATIENERDAFEDRDDDDGADRDPAEDQRMRELDQAQAEVEAESRALDEAEQALDRRSDELEREAEAKLWNLIEQWITDGSARKDSKP